MPPSPRSPSLDDGLLPGPAAACPAWSAAVFSSREELPTLAATLRALDAAAGPPLLVDVLVNGNETLARATAAALADGQVRLARTQARVWWVPLGDKAHCWNEYVHRLWCGSSTAFFVDGYVRVRPDALAALEHALTRRAPALAAGGVPTAGRTAAALREAMQREGGLHGNLFALPAATMRLLRERGFKLPLGVYRTDPILAAALAFALDPPRHEWDLKGRVAVVPEATWDLEPKCWWRWSDVRGQWRRLARQAQGTLENRAISDWLDHRRRPPEQLPGTASELVSRWAEENPATFGAALERDLRLRRAWRQLQAPRDWSAAQRPPELLFQA